MSEEIVFSGYRKKFCVHAYHLHIKIRRDFYNLKNGIRNNRFEVEFINDENGFPIKLNIKALGEFDTTTTSANSDTVVLLFGKIRLEVQISRYNKGQNDWELDGNIHVDLGK